MTIADASKNNTYEGFKKRYPHIANLIIFKTIDYAKNLGKAFDNMEEFDLEYPIVYDHDNDKWEAIVLIESQLAQGNLF